MPRLKRFCWDGMQIEVPTDWDPVTIDSMGGGGFCRLENGERMERLTAKWSRIQGSFNLEKNFRTMVKAVQKGVRRRKRGAAPFEFREGGNIPGARKLLRRYQHQTFSWTEGELSGWGALLYSQASNRATVLQITGDQSDVRLAGQIMGTFQDPQPGPNRRWEMHGVAFDTGPTWSLTSAKYDPRGVFRLDLSADARTNMAAMRWSLANLWLKETDIHKFITSSFSKEVRRYDLYLEHFRFLGHPAVKFERAINSTYRTGRAWLRRKIRWGKAYFMHGVAWQCEPSNRIFVISRTGDRDDAMPELLACARTMRCCELGIETAAAYGDHETVGL